MNIRIALPASRAARLLGSGVLLLMLMHAIVVACHLMLHRKAEAFTVLFDVDLESNLPTFYNCFLFFIGALLFLACGRLENGRTRRGWIVMACAFGFLGVDEGSQIHEKFMLATLRLINGGQQTGTELGWLYYAWVIPYGIAAAFLGLALLRWFLALDPVLRRGLLVSGVVYATGAVLMEMYSGKIAEGLDGGSMTVDQMGFVPCEIYPMGTCHLYANMRYIAVYSMEELLEMSGLVMCIYHLTRSLGARHTTIELVTASTGASSA